MHYQSIRVVRPGQFDSATAQTPGCGGVFSVESAARTAIHHRGEQHTIAYVLSGSFPMFGGRARRIRCHPARGRFPLCSSVATAPENQSFERSSFPMGRRPQHVRTYRFESAKHTLG
jgi:hypothetical protein